MRCFHNTFTDIYFHLAAEEYLLKQETDSVFMLWQDTPSVVMGKHQSVQLEVNREWAEEQQIQIARRFSGGGAVYHDLGNVNLTFIETVSRSPDFSLYLHLILDFLEQIVLPAKGDERLGIYLDGLKISGSTQCRTANRYSGPNQWLIVLGIYYFTFYCSLRLKCFSISSGFIVKFGFTV